jgi:peptidyl-prolyl cis-trans isomerase B (cyclophilin B)
MEGEFAGAGFTQNDLRHEAGTLSMLRENTRYGQPPEDSYHTAGSDFMILGAEIPRMDGLYAAFGRVISGMDAVDKIAARPVEGEALLQPAVILSAQAHYRGYSR